MVDGEIDLQKVSFKLDIAPYCNMICILLYQTILILVTTLFESTVASFVRISLFAMMPFKTVRDPVEEDPEACDEVDNCLGVFLV